MLPTIELVRRTLLQALPVAQPGVQCAPAETPSSRQEMLSLLQGLRGGCSPWAQEPPETTGAAQQGERSLGPGRPVSPSVQRPRSISGRTDTADPRLHCPLKPCSLSALQVRGPGPPPGGPGQPVPGLPQLWEPPHSLVRGPFFRPPTSAQLSRLLHPAIAWGPSDTQDALPVRRSATPSLTPSVSLPLGAEGTFAGPRDSGRGVWGALSDPPPHTS